MSKDDENLSALYHSDGKQEPPAHLDSLIISAARDAVSESDINVDANNSISPFSGRWTTLVSIAAVLVISVTLVPIVSQEAPPVESRFSEKGIQRALEQEVHRELSDDIALPDTSETFKPMKLMNIDTVEAEKSSVYKKRSVTPPAEEKMMMALAAGAPRYFDREKNGLASGKSSLKMNQKVSNKTLSPEQWLKKIRGLIDLDKLKNAREELVKFKEKYPEEDIDSSILEPLKE